MASRSNLGRIRPYPKGAYSAAVEYVYFDMVTNDGSTYLYINTTASTGTALSDTDYWQCLAQKGDTGASGLNGTNGVDGISRIFIRYSAIASPTDADISTTPNEYIGIYTAADTAETAPTTASSYTWYKIKGDAGTAATVAVGTVTTGTPAVNNSGTSEAAVLDFVLPNASDQLTIPTIAAQDLGTVTTDVTLDTSLYSVFKLKATANLAINISGALTIGRARMITIILAAHDIGTSTFTLGWPTNIQWSSDETGPASETNCNIVHLITIDAGVTWYGVKEW
jgi:hypothetical protein